jgi:hypothetical protein
MAWSNFIFISFNINYLCICVVIHTVSLTANLYVRKVKKKRLRPFLCDNKIFILQPAPHEFCSQGLNHRNYSLLNIRIHDEQQKSFPKHKCKFLPSRAHHRLHIPIRVKLPSAPPASTKQRVVQKRQVQIFFSRRENFEKIVYYFLFRKLGTDMSDT